MIEQEKVRNIVASNLVHYRKLSGLKQSYVAEKIGYSDKAISKWERGEGIPDIYVLFSLAEIYNIKVSDFLSERKMKKLPSSNRNRFVVSLLSIGLVWLIATIVFVFVLWFGKGQPWLNDWAYMPFIYAIPISFIISLIFNKIWGRRFVSFFLVSGIVWGIGLSLERSLSSYIDWAYLFYIVCIPLQVLTLFWYLLRKKSKSRYNGNE